jgi:hypothetical protein
MSQADSPMGQIWVSHSSSIGKIRADVAQTITQSSLDASQDSMVAMRSSNSLMASLQGSINDDLSRDYDAKARKYSSGDAFADTHHQHMAFADRNNALLRNQENSESESVSDGHPGSSSSDVYVNKNRSSGRWGMNSFNNDDMEAYIAAVQGPRC